MIGWWKLQQRSKLPRPRQRTKNLVCLKRSDRWRLMQPNAGTPWEENICARLPRKFDANSRREQRCTFRVPNTEADLWAGKGAKGRAEEWVDTSRIAWQKVTGVFGFWDGSYDNGKCGETHCLHGFLVTTRMVYFLKSLLPGIVLWMLDWVDARCLLTNWINGWKLCPLKACNCSNYWDWSCAFLSDKAIFGGTRRTRVGRDRAHHPCVVLEGGNGSGVRRHGGEGIFGIEG